MKVWIVERNEWNGDFFEDAIDSVWTDKDKARERVKVLNAMTEEEKNEFKAYEENEISFCSFGVEMNKEKVMLEFNGEDE